MSERYTICATLENDIAAVNRVVSVLRRMGLTTCSMNMSGSQTHGVQRLTLVVEGSHSSVDRATMLIQKLVDVIACVTMVDSSLERELCLVRFQPNAGDRPAAGDLILEWSGRIISELDGQLVAEVCGKSAELDQFIEGCRRFNLTEEVRTGTVAISCNQ